MKNYKTNKILKWLFVCLFLIVASCQQKFDKIKWSEREDPAFPPSSRPEMLNDLITNNKLVGLSFRQLIARLGPPDNKDGNIVIYKVDVDFGTDIDPVYTKDLEFTISKDSIITSLRVKEWKEVDKL